MSLSDFLFGPKVYCKVCGVRLTMSKNSFEPKEYVEYKDGYYCKNCSQKKSKGDKDGFVDSSKENSKN